MSTPEVHEITSARTERAAFGLPENRDPQDALYGDDYRRRCAEIRELDRRADIARVTS